MSVRGGRESRGGRAAIIREENKVRVFRSRSTMPPPVETPKSRRRDATEARDPRAARPTGRAGPARGRGVKQTARRTYRERRVFARPERAKHRAKLACASDWTRSRFSGASVKRRGSVLGRRFSARERARGASSDKDLARCPRAWRRRKRRAAAIGGEIEGIQTSEARVVGVRDVRPARSGHRGRSHCVGGVASVSRERAGENIKPCDTIAWWRALEGKREG